MILTQAKGLRQVDERVSWETMHRGAGGHSAPPIAGLRRLPSGCGLGWKGDETLGVLLLQSTEVGSYGAQVVAEACDVVLPGAPDLFDDRIGLHG